MARPSLLSRRRDPPRYQWGRGWWVRRVKKHGGLSRHDSWHRPDQADWVSDRDRAAHRDLNHGGKEKEEEKKRKEAEEAEKRKQAEEAEKKRKEEEEEKRKTEEEEKKRKRRHISPSSLSRRVTARTRKKRQLEIYKLEDYRYYKAPKVNVSTSKPIFLSSQESTDTLPTGKKEGRRDYIAREVLGVDEKF
ncbi:hypothetical protein Taro_053294 [Colocasia esculenta]|uniref:Uncharacterized protein n=1 Tax=Colocasia esculenta TaxID=4460 RepID=A0A843XLS1_COLES|nr:hypothetical protein [Colocasia esculenta]